METYEQVRAYIQWAIRNGTWKPLYMGGFVAKKNGEVFERVRLRAKATVAYELHGKDQADIDAQVHGLEVKLKEALTKLPGVVLFTKIRDIGRDTSIEGKWVPLTQTPAVDKED